MRRGELLALRLAGVDLEKATVRVECALRKPRPEKASGTSIKGRPELDEDERQRVLKQANEGRAAARKRGTKFGRKPKLSDYQQAEVAKRLAAGESYRSIAKTSGTHHATIAALAG